MPQLMQVVEGSGCIFSWPYYTASKFGSSLAEQYKYLFKEREVQCAAEWLHKEVSWHAVKAGDVVWIPFGHFSAVTASAVGPLALLALPYVNSQLVARAEGAHCVLMELNRQLDKCASADSQAAVPWTPATDLAGFHNWVCNQLGALKRGEPQSSPQKALHDHPEEAVVLPRGEICD